MNKKIQIVDLFCWVWWLSHWLLRQWFNIVAWIDFDKNCKFAFEKNNKSKFYERDIKDVDCKMIDSLYWKNCEYKILVWCAPCQPFSLMNNKKSNYFYNTDVEKKSPIMKYADLIRWVKPLIVSMENVSSLINTEKYPSFQYFLDTLKEEWYFYSYKVVDCTKYWIPQTRKRLVLLASKLGPIELIPETQKTPKTLRDTIWDLPKLKAWEMNKQDPLHRSRSLNDINLKRISAIPQNWWSLLDLKDKSLIPICHQQEKWKSYISNIYGRMFWDRPSPTLTTYCTWLGNWRFWHPEQNRAISLREAARIQTFPDSYVFFNDWFNPWIWKISKQIWNAVPVKLWEVIWKSIKKHLKEYWI